MTISLPERLQDGLGVKAGLTQGSQEGGLITVRDNPDGAGLQVGLPGTRVQADPATKLVAIRGTRDLAKVEALISSAGYTPTVPALG